MRQPLLFALMLSAGAARAAAPVRGAHAYPVERQALADPFVYSHLEDKGALAAPGTCSRFHCR
jgi:hypothetical protein